MLDKKDPNGLHRITYILPNIRRCVYRDRRCNILEVVACLTREQCRRTRISNAEARGRIVCTITSPVRVPLGLQHPCIMLFSYATTAGPTHVRNTKAIRQSQQAHKQSYSSSARV